MPTASMIELLEAGVHFGHQTQRWNPKMKPYIYGARNGIYVIDLRKTTDLLDEAYNLVRDFAAKGKNVLFVGTKKQAQEAAEECALRTNMYFVNERWLGGTLTNFSTIRKRIGRLLELEKMQEDGTFEVLPKKEVILLKKEMEKLEKNLGGIKEMTEVPGVMFIVDPKKEKIGILEARKLGIPVIGLVDTNCNPQDVDYAIPGNDDAIRAVKLIADCMANAVIEGKQGESMEAVEEAMEVEEVAEPTDMEEVVASEEVEEPKKAKRTKKVAEEAEATEETAEVEKPKRTRKKATTEEVAE